jgi:hypothetical protein
LARETCVAERLPLSFSRLLHAFADGRLRLAQPVVREFFVLDAWHFAALRVSIRSS